MNKIMVIGVILLALIVVGLFKFLPFSSHGKAKELAIAEDFDQVDIESENVEIEILPSESDSAKVELTGKNNNKYKLVADVKGDSLNIEVKDRLFSWISIGFNWSSALLKVYLPERNYDRLDVETDNGKVEVNELQSDQVNAKTDNGQIVLKNIQSSAVTTEADNGRITFENIIGDIIAGSNNGHISLLTDSLDRPIQMETDNGTIDIRAKAEPTNVTFDIKVDNGQISIFGDSVNDTVIGNGDNLIKLRAGNGKIAVHK